MSEYKTVLTNKAQKQLDKLSDNIAELIIESIFSLETNPRPIGYKKLKGREGYRIRVGTYRVIYEIFNNNLIIEIVNVGSRGGIYQD